MIDETFVRRIEDLATKAATPEIVEVKGHPFSTQELHPVREPKVDIPGVLSITTLQGLADYADQTDDWEATEVVIHVASPTIVRVVSELLPPRSQRAVYLEAKASVPSGIIGQALEAEAFIIGLMTQFEDSEDRTRLLELASSITDQESVNQSDDGITQTVQAKAGVLFGQEAVIKNPFELTPIRSFHEIDQVQSPFLFRVHRGSPGQAPVLVLKEADGGAWQNVAAGRIAEWLTAELKADFAIVR